ncbi:MAG: helix-turn-helix domain-containing protein [Planctomycetaceae bacterium]|nr:helix-turn-helix domain-containing protein [Planctomycetaceae bacterium]
MANRLAMDKTQGIMQLFAAGMSERQIARTLDIDRKSVDRELRLQGAKGANPTKAPTGCETTNSATVDASTINKAEASTMRP